MTSNPFIKRLENQQNEINEIIDRFTNLTDDYFTQDEASELKSRLDSLEKTFEKEIQKSTEDKKKLETELQNLHNDIETLKLTVDALKKKSWLKSFASKVFKWTKNPENRKMLKDGYTVIREFLPDSYKNSLPDGK